MYWSDGVARVKNCESKYNFIDKKGKLLSDEWFKRAEDFKDGFALVQRSDGQYNFIGKQGKFYPNYGLISLLILMKALQLWRKPLV